MLRKTCFFFAPKNLHQMLNRFKVAGAHPDLLAGIDPQKSAHNGQALIKLEQLLQKRVTPAGPEEQRRDRYEMHDLLFWLQDKRTDAARPDPRKPALGSEAESGTTAGLRSVVCKLTPFAPDHIVKGQLSTLFENAGIRDDFELPRAIGGGDVQSVLDDVREKHEVHMVQTEPLMVRGTKSVRFLRTLGVVLTVEDRTTTYLMTLPERFDNPMAAMDQGGGEISDECRAYLKERGMVEFDFRMGGSYSAVEAIVSAVEKLERLYRRNQGTCLRPGVCICIRLAGSSCHTTDDGLIVLPGAQPNVWEEYLMTLPQDKWNDLVRLNKDWRADNPGKLRTQRDRLMRVADMLHFHTVVLEGSGSDGRQWQEEFLAMMLREEGPIRKTVAKYKAQLKVADLKNRGSIRVMPELWRDGITQKGGDKDVQVAHLITSDGRIHFNASKAKVVPILKVLREHNLKQARRKIAFDKAMAMLEGLSRSACVELTIDPDWRDRCPDVAKCIEHFVKTAKPIAPIIAKKLNSQRKGLLIIVSDRYMVTSSGKALVPWDADVGALKVAMIGE
jgi:hypothetical protein